MQQPKLTPRGSAVSLPNGGLPEMISPYMRTLIESTGGAKGPIGLQFVAQPEKEREDAATQKDNPQEEYLYEEAPGVIYKFKGKVDSDGRVLSYGRMLWTISRFCATYCRFCFRGRLVGLPANASRDHGEAIAQRPYLTDEQIDEVMAFIQARPELNEVILSGGDPLISPRPYLTNILTKLNALQQSGDIDFIRIHTRAPITNPFIMQDWHYELFNQLHLPYMVLHINHPYELTPEVRAVVIKLQQAGVQLLSQSVLLKEVNDSVETLQTLFVDLAKLGIRPYYLHHNDPVFWAKSFTVPFKQAVQIWQQLRTQLSGIASTAKFVIDTPYGKGKVVVPESKWEEGYEVFYDFEGVKKNIK